MSFADDAESASRNGYLMRGCGVGRLLAQLAPELREEVESVLRDRPEITAPAIRKALGKATSAALPSAYTIQRHRRDVCSCNAEGS